MKSKFKEFSVSCGLEFMRNGEKKSHFVNATLSADPNLTVEEFRVEQLKAGLEVSVAVIQHATLRQSLTEDEARVKIIELKENYSGMIQRLESKSSKSNL